MNCESCGLPMQRPEDHGANDTANKYCIYCAPDGKLKNREQVRKGWIGYVIRTEGVSGEEAEDKVDEEMAKMPAWQ